MSSPSRKSGYNLMAHQGDVLNYITDIAQELAEMADRAGCGQLGPDLRQAILKAHGICEKPASAGNP
ncbi:MAG: hypothetical protein QM647_16075 [Asticcacaulis sp.]|uniref:hypothetical protein n=1 Tax=Asticcacaulis sp. TaxID=1872648 RepID=UPI0039E3A6B7